MVRPKHHIFRARAGVAILPDQTQMTAETHRARIGNPGFHNRMEDVDAVNEILRLAHQGLVAFTSELLARLDPLRHPIRPVDPVLEDGYRVRMFHDSFQDDPAVRAIQVDAFDGELLRVGPVEPLVRVIYRQAVWKADVVAHEG